MSDVVYVHPELHRPYDSSLRWLIESRSETGAKYLVDLGANNERGLCSCKWFKTQISPAIRKGKPIVKYCRHYNEARERFTRWMIHQEALKDKNTPEEL
jgi:hypothetical protein